MNALAPVYIDVYFMVNLLFNGGALLMTAWIRGVKASWWRTLLGASCGALYAAVVLFPQLDVMLSVPVKVLFSLAMLLIAFGYGSLQTFMRLIGSFYMVNFAAGGAVYGLHYLLMDAGSSYRHVLGFLAGSAQPEIKVAAVFVFSVACVSLYVLRSVITFRKEKALVQQHLASVTVTIGGRRQQCVGLIDTGNQLYEPLTRTPVMVMEASLWQDDLPDSWMKGIREAQVDKLIARMSGDVFEWQDRLRLVPFRGVNRGAQFMLALKPDLVVIEREGETFESTKVLVGLDAGKLVADGAYQAIIHPSLLG
ncbi:sigma-E processing peptidase SpoIIGA [Paenibacillus xanthanilyticus]|uniref:Sporulation sigma-E factor-processing peptidase n=1 Tax=Paenibacillus xanthanilyticus TaxID=1783531 RepID=A0ABV8KCY3_9BACL